MQTEAEHLALHIQAPADKRRHQRFKLDTTIAVHARRSGAVQGSTVDISESGIAAILKGEVQIGEIVELVFSLPFGSITAFAVVRNRTAFRYGFEFLDPSSIRDVIRHSCLCLIPCG
jgi:hypothetical protein